MVTKKDMDLKEINRLLEYLSVIYAMEDEYLEKDKNETKLITISFIDSYLQMVKSDYLSKKKINIEFLIMKLETLVEFLKMFVYEAQVGEIIKFFYNLENMINKIINEIKERSNHVLE